MAKKNEPSLVSEEPGLDAEYVKKRIEMLDQRLDHIDSVVTAVVERVMKQPVTLNVTCFNCGQNIESALVGIEKPTRKI